MKTIDEIPFMKELWKFRKKYYEPKNEDIFWHNIVIDAEELHNKYNSDFLDQLILVCVNDIDERARMKDAAKAHTKKELLLKLVNRLTSGGG